MIRLRFLKENIDADERADKLLSNLRATNVLTYNLNTLRGYGYYFDEIDQLSKIGYLRHYKIDRKIGSGAYGAVFSFLGNIDQVIKIYSDSVNLRQDLRRYKNIETQLYSGIGSLEHMPYFDSGQITDSRYFYVIMPRIIPIRDAPYFKHIESILDRLFWFVEEMPWGKFKDFEDFKRKTWLYLMKQFSPRINPKNYERDKQKIFAHRKIIDGIIKAAYTANDAWGGTDLHGGNIGYLPQKPDVFFYFDM